MKVSRLSMVVIAIISALVLLPGLSMADNQASYAGDASGFWSGGGKDVPGLPDGSCANMGAVGKQNYAHNFGFDIPVGATITDVSAEIWAGASDGQTVEMRLISDPVGPVLVGSQQTLDVAAVGSGNCASSVQNSTGGPLTFWGTNTGELTPAIANSSGFGLMFEKIETSQVKVDSICMEITYTVAGVPEVQESCFAEPELNGINVTKVVIGAVPGSDWSFTLNGTPFSIAAAGGAEPFEDLPDDTYTITETDAQGYTVSVDCGSFGSEQSNSIDVTVAEGDVVNCTFTNTEPEVEPASITIEKVLAEGSASPGSDWFFSLEGDDFPLGAGESETYPSLSPGVYNITEVVTHGYDVHASCTGFDYSNGNDFDITVVSGDDVTCTFTNTEVVEPSIVPTMNEWGMIIFVLLAGLGSLYYLRRQKNQG